MDEARLLYDDLSQVTSYLFEFEYQLAKQNALSDQIETLAIQQSEYDAFRKQFNMKLPFLNDILAKCNEFCSIDSNRSAATRHDLFNGINDANSLFKKVS